MQVKKNPQSDLERKRSIFLQIGFITALGAVLIAFEWSTPHSNKEMYPVWSEPNEDVDVIPIIREEKKLEVPKKIALPILLDFISDLEEIEEPDLDWSDECDENTKIDLITKEEEEEIDEVYYPYQLNEHPQFTGGESALMRYIATHIYYPAVCLELGIQGTVYLSFIVTSQGDVREVTVVRSVDSHLDRAAVAVLSSMPQWKPGRQNGKKVNVRMQIPVKFKIQSN